MMYILLILFITITFIIYLIYSKRINKNIVFYNNQEASIILKKDPDGYFNKLNSLDKQAMNITNTNDYIDKVANSTLSFSDVEKRRISSYTKIADDFLYGLKIPYLDTKKIAGLKWKFILTKDNINSDGMPHTKGDIIYLSTITLNNSKKLLIQTLIHEKIHIYQRAFPNEIKEWIEKNNYIQYRNNNLLINRSNPDVDEWSYMKDGKECIALYNKNPNNLNSVIYPFGDSKSEHPYEDMAYYISGLYQ